MFETWTRKTLGTLAAAVLLCAGCAPGPEPEPGEAAEMVSSHAAPQVRWGDELTPALKRAQSEGLPVLVNFYADWCVWCKRMESETFSDREVAGLLGRQVVPVRLDVDGEGRDLSRRMGVSGLPTTILLTADGREVGRIDGYQPPAAFRSRLGKLLEQAS